MLDPMSMSADALILLEQSGSQSSVGQQLPASIKDIWKHDSGPKWPHLDWISILKCVLQSIKTNLINKITSHLQRLRLSSEISCLMMSLFMYVFNPAFKILS